MFHLHLHLVLAILQSQSCQLFGPLLQEVDVSDRVGQSFNHIWRAEENTDRL